MSQRIRRVNPRFWHFKAIGYLFLLLALESAHTSGISTAVAQAAEVDITREGSVQASTTYAGFPVSMMVDSDRSTSWFSTGPEPGGVPTRFQWTHPRDDKITTIYIHGNGDHKDPSIRKNYGFSSVTVQVLDAANKVVFQQAVPLPGTPDPDVLLHPNVIGRTVLLLMIGHEAQDCGGFSELQIKADRTPPTPIPTIAPTLTSVPPTPSAVPATATLAQTTAVAPTSIALVPAPTTAASGIPGDCDGDSRVTESDALCALEMSTQLRLVNLNMDMDKSGDVTSRDVVILLQGAIGK